MENPQPPTPNPQPPADISANAHSLARAIDRACRQPGSYLIMLDVRDSRHWTITINQADKLQILQLKNLTDKAN